MSQCERLVGAVALVTWSQTCVLSQSSVSAGGERALPAVVNTCGSGEGEMCWCSEQHRSRGRPLSRILSYLFALRKYFTSLSNDIKITQLCCLEITG